MRCAECGGPLVSILERSRKVCAECYLRHRFRAEHQPEGPPTEARSCGPSPGEAAPGEPEPDHARETRP